MCFDQRTSGFFALLGFAMTVYAHRKARNPGLTLGVGYFFLMELLQVVQYSFIDDCNNPVNRFLTSVGFLHICFQPYFTHRLSMSLVKSREILAQFSAVRKLCVIGGVMMFGRHLLGLFGYSSGLVPTEACPTHEWVRGADLCTYSGRYHLAWSIPMYDVTYYSPGIALHFFLMFAPFFIVRRPTLWAQGLLLFSTGPALAAFITPNLQEQASIWCFFSISQIAVMLFLIRHNMTYERSQIVLKAQREALSSSSSSKKNKSR